MRLLNAAIFLLAATKAENLLTGGRGDTCLMPVRSPFVASETFACVILTFFHGVHVD